MSFFFSLKVDIYDISGKLADTTTHDRKSQINYHLMLQNQAFYVCYAK